MEVRPGLVGDFALVVVVDAEGAALFADVVEGRVGRGAGLVAVVVDVRVGLAVEDLLASLAAVVLVVVRAVVAGFSPPGLEVGFGAAALVVSALVSLLTGLALDESFGVSLGAGFWEASSEADAAGCASCCANAGTSSDLVVVFPSPFWAIALASKTLGDPDCSSVVEMPKPLPLLAGRSGLFWPTSASTSSELKLLTREGDARPSA